MKTATFVLLLALVCLIIFAESHRKKKPGKKAGKFLCIKKCKSECASVKACKKACKTEPAGKSRRACKKACHVSACTDCHLDCLVELGTCRTEQCPSCPAKVGGKQLKTKFPECRSCLKENCIPQTEDDK